jgi:hypothetical protein
MGHRTPQFSPPLLTALGESLAQNASRDREQRIQIQYLPTRIDLGRDALALMPPPDNVREFPREDPVRRRRNG